MEKTQEQKFLELYKELGLDYILNLEKSNSNYRVYDLMGGSGFIVFDEDGQLEDNGGN